MEKRVICKFCSELGFLDEENTFDSLKDCQEHVLHHLWTDARMTQIQTVKVAKNESEFQKIYELCFEWNCISSMNVEKWETQQLPRKESDEILQNAETKKISKLRKPDKNLTSKQCRKHFTPSKAVQNPKGTSNVKCETCGKYFPFASQMRSHMRVHTGERPFKCKICGKSFSYNHHLEDHLRRHTGERPFKCKDCGKNFNRSCHLARHRKIHSGEKRFQCKHCKKCFARMDHLNIHMRTHTGAKPFKCEQCGEWFAHSNSLHRHVKTHCRK